MKRIPGAVVDTDMAFPVISSLRQGIRVGFLRGVIQERPHVVLPTCPFSLSFICSPFPFSFVPHLLSRKLTIYFNWISRKYMSV